MCPALVASTCSQDVEGDEIFVGGGVEGGCRGGFSWNPFLRFSELA